jgi:peptide deformylase
VTEFNPHLHQLLDDMADTLRDANGVGLAAPQVGVMRRAVIVLETNVSDGEEDYVIELINPEIIASDGEQTGAEGCLSVPNEYGIVTRPMDVTVRAQNRFGQWFEVKGNGLTARAMCHELDHLEGHIFLEKCQRMLTEAELSGDKEE